MYVYDLDGDKINVTEPSIYNGKTISFLGDSITTYIGYIPSGQSYEYNGNNNGVSSVNDTWWMKLINSLGMTLNINNSWSGTCVTNIRDSVKGSNSSAVARCTSLGTVPDVIIFYMGINDFCFEAPLGTYEGLAPVPSDRSTFSSAYAMALDGMMTAYPKAEIWCATLPQCERNASTGAPEINDDGVSLVAFNECIKKIALTFGAKVLDFAQSGLTYQNMNLFMGDWGSGTGQGLHPNADGMSVLANQAIRQLDPYVRARYSI